MSIFKFLQKLSAGEEFRKLILEDARYFDWLFNKIFLVTKIFLYHTLDNNRLRSFEPKLSTFGLIGCVSCVSMLFRGKKYCGALFVPEYGEAALCAKF